MRGLPTPHFPLPTGHWPSRAAFGFDKKKVNVRGQLWARPFHSLQVGVDNVFQTISLLQAWATSISGYPALIWPMRATTSGWPPGVPSRSPTGMPANRTISATRTGRRRTASSCGIAMAKVSSGTIRRAASRRISCARCSLSERQNPQLHTSPTYPITYNRYYSYISSIYTS